MNRKLMEESKCMYRGEPVECLHRRRNLFKAGDRVEIYFPDRPYSDYSKLGCSREEYQEYQKAFNGIQAVVVRSLGVNEDLGGFFDYMISWCEWKDPRLHSFMKKFRTDKLGDILDPRVCVDWIRKAEQIVANYVALPARAGVPFYVRQDLPIASEESMEDDCSLCYKRSLFKAGDLIEVHFPDVDESLYDPQEYQKYQEAQKNFNGIRAVVVRPLGQHEDCGGYFDYIVSWCEWRDPRLHAFITKCRPEGMENILDPRVCIDWVRKVEK